MRFSRHQGLRDLRSLLLLGTVALVSCSADAPPPQSVEPGSDMVCTLDGMSLADYPGPKAQIFFGNEPPVFFCDTVEMFAMVLGPESQRDIRAVYTQDMARADWQRPRGHWIDARTAFYVMGSARTGSMGPTFASFAQRAEAEAFAAKHGGQVLAFSEITPAMADLRGGAAHDLGM